MAVYNIQTNTGYNIPKSNWNNGNNRDNIDARPQFGLSNYTICAYDFTYTMSGSPFLVNNCKTDIFPLSSGRIFYGPIFPLLIETTTGPEAMHSTNLNEDIMIYDGVVFTYYSEE